eukprot:1449713-Rhodomonas_salina.1
MRQDTGSERDGSKAVGALAQSCGAGHAWAEQRWCGGEKRTLACREAREGGGWARVQLGREGGGWASIQLGRVEAGL